jgi:hypothetical protein
MTNIQSNGGHRYKLPPRKKCYICGGPISRDEFQRSVYSDGEYEYYFCQNCHDQKRVDPVMNKLINL